MASSLGLAQRTLPKLASTQSPVLLFLSMNQPPAKFTIHHSWLPHTLASASLFNCPLFWGVLPPDNPARGGPSAGCTRESPGMLSKLLMPEAHTDQLKSDSLGVEPGHQCFQCLGNMENP